MRSIRSVAHAQKSSESRAQREQHPRPEAGGVSLNLAFAAALDIPADAVDVLRL